MELNNKKKLQQKDLCLKMHIPLGKDQVFDCAEKDLILMIRKAQCEFTFPAASGLCPILLKLIVTNGRKKHAGIYSQIIIETFVIKIEFVTSILF